MCGKSDEGRNSCGNCNACSKSLMTPTEKLMRRNEAGPMIVVDEIIQGDAALLNLLQDLSIMGRNITDNPQRGEKLFNDSLDIINGERQNQYGDPEDSFDLVAERWSQYLTCRYGLAADLDGRDVAFMMADLKMARECSGHKRDNLLDATGYLGILDDIL